MNGAREGFSLVEVIVAVVILSIGILAMAATTGYIFTRLRDAGAATERTLAVQQVIERLRAMPYDDVAARDPSVPDSAGNYRFWWAVREPTAILKQVVIVSEGPGYGPGGWTLTAQDTAIISLFKP